MIHFLCIVWAYSLVAVTKTQNDSTAEDLVAEYYTTTPAYTEHFTQQDEDDAKAIWDNGHRADIIAGQKEDVIASIIMYRDKIRRYAITQTILKKEMKYIIWRRKKRYWIVPTHNVQWWRNSKCMFKDLVYGLTYDENLVLGQYISNFFSKKDETWINIGMVLSKDIQNMTATYDKNHRDDFAILRDDFATLCNAQRKPFKFMLRAWVREPRAAIETGNIDPKLISQDAQNLKTEYENGGWHENRAQIELVLMRKSIKYARLVIQEFEKLVALNKPLEDIIFDSIKDHRLNHDLADTYSSLTRYIKDKYKYIADLLDKYSDGKDRWAAWIMCIAVVRLEEWPKVDDVFKRAHNGDSLSKFILQKLTDKVMSEMIALTVDSKFTPISFTKKPVPGDPVQPPAVPLTSPAPTSL